MQEGRVKEREGGREVSGLFCLALLARWRTSEARILCEAASDQAPGIDDGGTDGEGVRAGCSALSGKKISHYLLIL